MEVEKRLPNVGDRLTHHLKGKGEVVAEVVSVNALTNKVSLRIGDTTYSSLSTAAQSISGYIANGWIFWRLKKQTRKRNEPPAKSRGGARDGF